MPSSPYSSVLYAAIVGSAIFAFQQIRSHFNIASLSFLLVAFAVARARVDIFLIGAFLLVGRLLFYPRQPACAASTTNPATCPVQEFPSDVESLSNSSTNPEGGLKSGAGVVAGNLAAQRELDHPCPISQEYDWLKDRDNLQSNDPSGYYRFIATKQAGPLHSHPAPRLRCKFTAPSASTSFTPHKIASAVPPPANPKRENKERGWSRSRSQDDKLAQPTSHVTQSQSAPSVPSIGQLWGLSAQQLQDKFYFRHMENLRRKVEENLRCRVEQNLLADTLREMQHLFQSMSVGSLSSSVAPRYPAVSVWQTATQYQDIEIPMDVDIANADIVYERMDQDEPRQYACAFVQTSSSFAPQHAPFLSQSSQPQSWPCRPFVSAFGQTSPPAFAFGQSWSQSAFSSVAQPATPVQPSQSTPFRATLRPPTSAFAQHHARDQEQQREAQLQAQREEERQVQQLHAERQAQEDRERLVLHQEQQRRANLEAQAWVAADAEQHRREKEAELLAAEEQRKKEASAKERARVSAKMRSSIRTEKIRAQVAEEMAKPAKKVAFADENAPPARAFSAPLQRSSNAPWSQLVASSSSGPSMLNPASAALDFLAEMAKTLEPVEIEDPNPFPDAPDEGEETEVDDFAQAQTVKQAQGEHNEPEGFEEMAEKIIAASGRRKTAADFF